MGEHNRDCRLCAQPMTGSRNAAPGERKHVSRGLCSSCYYKVHREGNLENYPKLQKSREAIVLAFIAARKGDPDVSQLTVATRLGIPRTTLAMALRRAVELGDSRITKEEGMLDAAE